MNLVIRKVFMDEAETFKAWHLGCRTMAGTIMVISIQATWRGAMNRALWVLANYEARKVAA